MKKKYKYFVNREVSWLYFNMRVLEEGMCEKHPLLERVRFLSIALDNLDEFLEIRLSDLEKKLVTNIDKTSLRYRISALMRYIDYLIELILRNVARTWKNILIPLLAQEGCHFISYEEMTDSQKQFVETYYQKFIKPYLTKEILHVGDGLLWKKSRTWRYIVELNNVSNSKILFGVVDINKPLPSILELPQEKTKKHTWIFLVDILKHYFKEIFYGYKVVTSSAFRVLYNLNLSLEEADYDDLDLLEMVTLELASRQNGQPVRVEVDSSSTENMIHFFQSSLLVQKRQVYMSEKLFHIYSLIAVYDIISEKPFATKLKFDEYMPCTHPLLARDNNLFEVIQKQDILLHHPYDSFSPIIYFINQVASDPYVQSIFMTLYRVTKTFPFSKHLIKAKKKGKNVVVLIELRARFDEKLNVKWTNYLKEHGIKVIYGRLPLKTHCKFILVSRNENNQLKYYAHVGTGNYNEITANIYTDLSFFTANSTITRDLEKVSQFLMGDGTLDVLKVTSLLVSPFNLQDTFLSLIQNEIDHARQGKEAEVIIKVNSLADHKIIRALYKASEAGVKIIALVRGICCLRPSKKRYSENIIVHSIVGRYLEHSRIFYFKNAHPYNIFIGSADWMKRNVARRVEIVIPIIDTTLAHYIYNKILLAYIRDTYNVRINGKGLLKSREFLMQYNSNTVIFDSQSYFQK